MEARPKSPPQEFTVEETTEAPSKDAERADRQDAVSIPQQIVSTRATSRVDP